ncbi:hypothetical protein GCM10017559_56970 [Streptosporangium longisporum]|uniref:Uncharacterized protein n=1 Tax=Streptosporangium longisporum TaxID=46187 RepID=A0ABN3YFA6_9ACTN
MTFCKITVTERGVTGQRAAGACRREFRHGEVGAGASGGGVSQGRVRIVKIIARGGAAVPRARAAACERVNERGGRHDSGSSPAPGTRAGPPGGRPWRTPGSGRDAASLSFPLAERVAG